MRGETAVHEVDGHEGLNFNPLPSCEGRQKTDDGNWIKIPISIHSPHARGDMAKSVRTVSDKNISIHSPHARGDKVLRVNLCEEGNFNPLPSCEGRRLCRRL